MWDVNKHGCVSVIDAHRGSSHRCFGRADDGGNGWSQRRTGGANGHSHTTTLEKPELGKCRGLGLALWRFDYHDPSVHGHFHPADLIRSFCIRSFIRLGFFLRRGLCPVLQIENRR